MSVSIFYDSVPDDYKKNPGAVEAIAEQPGHPDNILIGYNRGLMVLWNKATPGAQQVSLHVTILYLSLYRILCIQDYSMADVMTRLQNNSNILAYYICGVMLNPSVHRDTFSSDPPIFSINILIILTLECFNRAVILEFVYFTLISIFANENCNKQSIMYINKNVYIFCRNLRYVLMVRKYDWTRKITKKAQQD